MAEDVGEGLGGGLSPTCSYFDQAELLRHAATKRLIEERPSGTHVVYVDRETLIRDLEARHGPLASAENVFLHEDGHFAVYPADGTTGDHYYPKDTSSYQAVYESLAWITLAFDYFEDLNKTSSLQGPIADLADLAHRFDASAALAQVLARNSDTAESLNDEELPAITIPNDAYDWQNLGSVRNYLGDWEGSAAETFHSLYVDRFDDYVVGQKALIVLLYQSLVVARSAYAAGQADAMQILDATIACVEGEFDFDFDLAAALSVISAVAGMVAGIAAAVPTGGTSLAAAQVWSSAMTVVSGAGSLGATVAGRLKDHSDGKAEISGATAPEILKSMREALVEVKTTIVETERQLADWIGGFVTGLSESSEWVPDGMEGANITVRNAHFEPFRPALLDLAVTHNPSAADGLSESEAERILEDVLSDDGLGTTAALTKKLIAGDFGDLRSAAGLIDSIAGNYEDISASLAGVDSAAGDFSSDAALPDGAYAHAGTVGTLQGQWSGLYRTTCDIIDGSRESLTDIAALLRLVADSFEAVDWANAKEIWGVEVG